MRLPTLAPLMLAAALSTGTAAGDEPCATAAFRQFDFWVGDWTVSRSDDGQPAGHNRIEAVLGGCALHESWVGAKGSRGYSYNVYDATRGVWHQTWVDSSGGLLVLEGGLRDGRMVLEGDQLQADGSKVHNRITWTPLADGRVRQRWDATSDGKTWSVVFDGTYARRAPGGGAGRDGLRIDI
jgi:hypothetical protein